MRITNKKREEVAYELTKRAFNDQLSMLANRLKVLNLQFWNRHEVRMVELTGLSPAKMAELVGQGVMRAASSGIPRYGEKHDFVEATLVDRDHWDVFHSVVNSQHDFHLLKDLTDYSRAYRILRMCLVPHKSGMVNFFEMWHFEDDHILLSEMKLAIAAVAKTVQELGVFHQQVLHALQAFNTLSKLKEGFPEAAELVTPAEASGQLVPVEMIESVRARLNNPPPAKISRTA